MRFAISASTRSSASRASAFWLGTFGSRAARDRLPALALGGPRADGLEGDHEVGPAAIRGPSQPAAVDHVVLAGDGAGLVGGEEQHDAGDVVAD